MIAIIKTGGKQYKVVPGDKLKIEKLDKKEGEEIIFDQVLLVEKSKKIQIGAPLVKDAKVVGKVYKAAFGNIASIIWDNVRRLLAAKGA